MTCPICDQKARNCDCSESEKRLHSELEEANSRCAELEEELSSAKLEYNTSEETVVIVITGGRDFLDWSAVHRLLYELYYDHGDRLRIGVGDCPTGVDAAVISWLTKHSRVAHKIYKAAWQQHGRKAGPLRNALMIDTEKPCVVFAFPGGKGTEHCKGYAKSKGISVVNMPIERKDNE